MKNKLVNILPWVFMLIAMVLLATFFNKGDSHQNYKDELKTRDSIIAVIIKQREADRLIHERMINELHEKDSLLRLRYKTTVINYERIPVIVAGLSDTALRSAIESFR